MWVEEEDGGGSMYEDGWKCGRGCIKKPQTHILHNPVQNNELFVAKFGSFHWLDMEVLQGA